MWGCAGLRVQAQPPGTGRYRRAQVAQGHAGCWGRQGPTLPHLGFCRWADAPPARAPSAPSASAAPRSLAAARISRPPVCLSPVRRGEEDEGWGGGGGLRSFRGNWPTTPMSPWEKQPRFPAGSGHLSTRVCRGWNSALETFTRVSLGPLLPGPVPQRTVLATGNWRLGTW